MSLLNILLVLLPLIGLFLVFNFIYIRPIKHSFIEAAIVSLLLWSFLVFIGIEFLSFFSSLDTFNMAFYWVILDVYFVSLSLKYGFYIPNFKFILKDTKKIFGNKLNALLSFFIIIAISSQFIIAFMSPPNNSDSMTYHMSRVYHWIQNASVENYATSIQRQLYQPPFGGYILTTFQVLSTSDRFALLTQWMFYVFTLLAVILLTDLLGATLQGKILAVFFAVTTPMGILQATSAQNNYILTFYLFCAAIYTYKCFYNASITNFVYFGLSLGLAILTKGTGYFFIFPMLIIFIVSQLAKYKLHAIKWLLFVAILAASLNLHHWYKNYSLFKSPLGPSTEGPGAEYMNHKITLTGLISNIIKNSALQLGSTAYLDRRLELRTVAFHNYLVGTDIQNPIYTWGLFAIPDMVFRHEDISGNFPQVALILISVPLFFLRKKFNPYSIIYLLSLVVGFLLFCLILRWQPWHSRLLLPLFIMYAPIAGIALENILLTPILVVLIWFWAIPYFMKNNLHPILGKYSVFKIPRGSQYFMDSRHLEASYVEVAKYVRRSNKQTVGIIWGGDDWEYPLLALMPKKVAVHHINIDNNPSKKLQKWIQPDIILVRGIGRGREGPTLLYNGLLYQKKLETTHVSLFEKPL